MNKNSGPAKAPLSQKLLDKKLQRNLSAFEPDEPAADNWPFLVSSQRLSSVDMQTNAEAEVSKPALIFDADSITLTGKFTDELAAYRARKSWNDALATFFLLEKARDFEMKISFEDGEEAYVLRCAFHSACGRYAFWRLVNHQAPEVELKLYTSNMVSKRSARFLLGSLWNNQPPAPWVTSPDAALESCDREVQSTKSVILSLLRYFNKKS
ncbi:MAG: hypothetical protein IT290_13185 [Deltaproteobacteria bacterium]|nr:hypothetical protein [Deltaproteobacteria bacterium]